MWQSKAARGTSLECLTLSGGIFQANYPLSGLFCELCIELKAVWGNGSGFLDPDPTNL